MIFNRSETYVLWITGVAAAGCAILALMKGVTIDLLSFDKAILFNAAFLIAGLYYRHRRNDEPLAAVLLSICLLMVSGHVLGVLNYLQLPYHIHGMDRLLEQSDAAMGFHWATFVTWIAQFPTACAVLKAVYLSCPWQICVIIFALAMTRQLGAIGKYMLAVTIGAAITTEMWALIPSSTPAAFQPLPPEAAAILGLVVSPEQGAWLKQISYEGLKVIRPEDLIGVVGFPSYHTVLALTAVWYARTIKFVFWPIFLLNVLMLPAIIVHGSHNVTDVFGGIAVTALSIWLAWKIGNPAPLSTAHTSIAQVAA